MPLAELYASGTGVARDPVEAYALAVIAEVVLDDSDLFAVRLAELKAALGKELSALANEGRPLTRSGHATRAAATHHCQGAAPVAGALAFGMVLTSVVYRSTRRALQ